MGGEDFSRYGLAGVPICMFRLGAVNQKRLDEFAAQKIPPPSLHSPVFYPDAGESLETGRRSNDVGGARPVETCVGIAGKVARPGE